MKKNIKYLVLSIIAFGLFSVSTATAGECSESDPCGTWAVLGANNQVVNIIVCQASVCGSGTFGENRVVLQVPANPVTNESQGGYLGNSGNSVTYNETKNEFTLNNKTETVKVEVVEVNKGTSEESSDVLVTKVSTISSSTFIPTVLTGTTPTINPVENNNSSATISATSTVVNSETTIVEEYTFPTQQTSSQIDEVITEQSYPLLKTHIARIRAMLGSFII
jgi:hypothetical protein